MVVVVGIGIQRKSVKYKDTQREVIQSRADELVEKVTAGIQLYRKHTFNIRHQYGAQRKLRESLLINEQECALHIDFSENYNCGYEKEIMVVHFQASHKQATLHTGLLYIGGDAIPFTTSDRNRHDPAAVWA